MSVRQSLLAILDQGPCYGYQLRAEFDRRTGSTWPLNVGQIYNTLDRLERDGLVVKGAADAQGHVFYEITPEGRHEVRAWFRSPASPPAGTRAELPLKLALAATLPGVDVTGLLQAQQAATATRIDVLRAAADTEPADGAERFAASLVRDSQLFEAEAEARWLEHVEQRLAARPQREIALELSENRPKRGRPAKSETLG